MTEESRVERIAMPQNGRKEAQCLASEVSDAIVGIMGALESHARLLPATVDASCIMQEALALRFALESCRNRLNRIVDLLD